MTIPLSFGGGVGSQQVIQQPGIAEQIAPLLQLLQQQQAVKQAQAVQQQEAARAQQEQEFRALQELMGISTDIGLLRSEAGEQLAMIAGQPELAEELAVTEEARMKQEVALLEEAANLRFPDDSEKASGLLVGLKMDLNPEIDAGTVDRLMEGIFGPSDLEIANTALAEARATKLNQEIRTAKADAKNEANRVEANRRVAQLLKIPEEAIVDEVDYIGIHEQLLKDKGNPRAAAMSMAGRLMDRQTLIGKVQGVFQMSVAEAIDLSIQAAEGVYGVVIPRDNEGPIQMQLRMAEDGGALLRRIFELREAKDLTQDLAATDAEGQSARFDATVWNAPMPQVKRFLINLLIERFPSIKRKLIEESVQRSFNELNKNNPLGR